MEAATAGRKQQPEGKGDPRFEAAREEGQGDPGREMAAHAAQGAELNAEEETQALDFLLGAAQPVVHDVPTQLETPNGQRKLVFVIKQLDTRVIDGIENRHLNQTSGRIDRLSADCEIVSQALVTLRDGKRSVDPKSQEFLTVERPEGPPLTHASPSEALEDRFRKQLGLINGVALEIRKLAGFDPERVGAAQRRLVEASGN